MSYIPTTEDNDKHPGGRPLKYETKEALQADIDKYFKECDDNGKPYTICGLANALGITRQTLINYTEKDEFLDTVKKSKSKCEQFAEERLFDSRQVAGVIFNLKNNYKWRDEQKHDISGNIIIGKPPTYEDAEFPE